MSSLPDDLQGRVAVGVGELRTMLGIGRLAARRLAKQIGVRIGNHRIVIPVDTIQRLLRGEIRDVSITTNTTRVITASEHKQG